MRLGGIDNFQDMAGGTGLNQEADVIVAGITARLGQKDVGRGGMPVIITGDLGYAGVPDLIGGFDVLEQSRLHAQDRLGVIVEVRVVIGPGRDRTGEECHGRS